MIKTIDASPSDNGDWLLIKAEGMKTHFVHKCLVPQLIADLESRNAAVYIAEPVRKAYIEFMISNFMIVGRPIEKINIDMLEISILSRDVGIVCEESDKLTVRKFSDGTEYYKLKSSFCCIVFTLDQFALFTNGTYNIVESALNRDIEFIEAFKKKKSEDA